MTDKCSRRTHRRHHSSAGGGCLVALAAPTAALLLGAFGIRTAFADDNATSTASRPNPPTPALTAEPVRTPAKAGSTAAVLERLAYYCQLKYEQGTLRYRSPTHL